MKKEIKKIIGLSVNEWNTYLDKTNEDTSNVHFEEIRLIPTEKMGDERALTSIFLSSLKLIDEFRYLLFKEIGLKKVTRNSKSKELLIYREIALTDKLMNVNSNKLKSIFDGLVLIVKQGKIVDAAIFEMKNKKNKLEENQIRKYKDLAESFKIPKIVTISNEFVSSSTNNPLNMKSTKSLKFVHLSWKYILTQAKMLLFKEKRIDDEDQVAIMSEIVKYFDDEKSNIVGFSNMGESWKSVQLAYTQKRIPSDKDLNDVSINWIQEERDMALKLSEKLGELVKIKNIENIKTQKDKINQIKKLLKTEKSLNSSLIVKNAVSNINISVNLFSKTVDMSILGKPKHNDVSSLKKFKNMFSQIETKNNKLNSIKEDLLIEPRIKHKKNNKKHKLDYFSKNKILYVYKNQDVVDFRICYNKKLNFGSRKFTQELEQMLINFYDIVVSNLLKPTPKTAPKVRIGLDEKVNLESKDKTKIKQT